MKFENVEYVLFDLDGTITDPFEGITNSVMYSLEKFGIKVTDKRELSVFIGPPLLDSYMKYYGFSKEKAEKAVAYYREYYPVNGIFDCTLYDGIVNSLSKLSEKYKLVLATSKPEPFAKKILDKFNLSKYFYYVVGATFDSSVSEKSDVIRKVMNDLKISPNNAIMIGDRSYDVDGAKVNGMRSVGVTYGYGKKSEFSNANAVVDNTEELLSLFL